MLHIQLATHLIHNVKHTVTGEEEEEDLFCRPTPRPTPNPTTDTKASEAMPTTTRWVVVPASPRETLCFC